MMSTTERKFKRPIVMCAVGANGSVLAGNYPRGRLPIAVEYFCERPVGRRMEMPLNVFYADANGRSAHAIMDEHGVRTAIEDPLAKKKSRSGRS